MSTVGCLSGLCIVTGWTQHFSVSIRTAGLEEVAPTFSQVVISYMIFEFYTVDCFLKTRENIGQLLQLLQYFKYSNRVCCVLCKLAVSLS
jgi:hypothetical protein